MKVFIEAPLKKILQRPDTSGQLMNWALELSEFDIEYALSTAIKRQVLASFVAKFTGIPKETKQAPPLNP